MDVKFDPEYEAVEITRVLGNPSVDARVIYDLKRRFSELHPSDQAEVMLCLKPYNYRAFTSIVSNEIDPDFLFHFSPGEVVDFFKAIDEHLFVHLVSAMPVYDIVRLVQNMQPKHCNLILSNVSLKKRIRARELLGFPPNSAGRVMSTDFLQIPTVLEVKGALEHVRKYRTGAVSKNFAPQVFVHDSYGKLYGSVAVIDLIRMKPEQIIGSSVKKEVHFCKPNDNVKDIIKLFTRYDLKNLPVVDDLGRMIGVVELPRVTDLISDKFSRDLLSVSGVFIQEKHGRFDAIKVRAIWLFINLLTAIFASFFIGIFEDLIAGNTILAVMMPITASMGGNAGTQSSGVVLMSLATKEFGGHKIMDEVLCGVLNGFIFGLMCFLGVFIAYNNIMLGLAFGGAVSFTLFSASLFGSILPPLIQRLRLDPAVVTTVILTTLTDVIGFFSFLGLAQILL